MAKYYKFHYSAGYVGTDETAVYKYADSVEEKEVQEDFDEWYEEQRKDCGNFEEISEEEAEEEGVDEDYSEWEESL